MMRRTIGLVALALAISAPVSAETLKLGEPMESERQVTPIVEILDAPDAWVGKTVRIEGRVAEVCTKMGCWMDLVSPEDARMQVKVDDGVIVFPLEAVGRHASAEGKVEILDMSRDQYEAWLRHAAEETGKEFDPTRVGDGPYRIVRLRGLGAEIHDS
jgi:hypothetical protein